MPKRFQYSGKVKHWKVHTQKFRYCETNDIRLKMAIPSLFLSLSLSLSLSLCVSLSPKLFREQNFYETQKGPLQFFFVLWVKTFSTGNCDIPLIWLCLRIPEKNETLNGSTAKSFSNLRAKKIRQNPDTPIIQRNFDTREFLKHWRVCYENFWNNLGQKIPTENHDLSRILLYFFDTRSLWKAKGSPAKKFGTERQNKIDRKSWFSQYPNYFWYQNPSETQKGSLKNISG